MEQGPPNLWCGIACAYDGLFDASKSRWCKFGKELDVSAHANQSSMQQALGQMLAGSANVPHKVSATATSAS